MTEATYPMITMNRYFDGSESSKIPSKALWKSKQLILENKKKKSHGES